MMEKDKVPELFKKFQEGTCSEEELELLRYWVHHLNEDSADQLSVQDLQQSGEAMWHHINEGIGSRSRVVKMKRMVAVAASIIILLVAGLSLRLYFTNKTNTDQPYLSNNIEIGTNKAFLTLSDGRVVDLEHASVGTLFKGQTVSATKSGEGQLVYALNDSGSTSIDAALPDNILTVPFGGQYQVTLVDGTRVWLNAGSSLRFPARFSEGNRVVELSGEAYFEVAHIALPKGQKVKFTVNTGGAHPQAVEVLGTHFNISAYENDSLVKTTLLEGKVNVRRLQSRADGKKITLLPGQQSVLSTIGVNVRTTDTEESIAWKNGYFRFNDETLEDIMKKVERWYKVKVNFQREDLRRKKFAGITTRFANVSELLKMLELTGEVSFIIDKNIITAR